MAETPAATPAEQAPEKETMTPLAFLKALVLGALIILLLTFARGAWMVTSTLQPLHELAVRINEASKPLLDCVHVDPKTGKRTGNGACLPAQFLGTMGAIEKASGSVAKNMPAIAESAKQASSNSAEASQAVTETARESKKLVINLNGLVDDFRTDARDLHVAITDMDAGVKALLASSDTTMQAAGGSLTELTELEKQLGTAIEQGTPKVLGIADSMLAILNDADLKTALVNVNSATHHGAEIAETMDLATRDLRKKAALVKTILLRMIGFVKFAINF